MEISEEEKLIYSGIRALFVHPFNCNKRDYNDIESTYSDESLEEEQDKTTLRISRGRGKTRDEFMYNLLWCITKKDEVVACSFKFSENSKLYIGCNYNTKEEQLVTIIQEILKYKDSFDIKKKDIRIQERSHLQDRLSEYISSKISKRIESIKKKQGELELEKYTSIKEVVFCKKEPRDKAIMLYLKIADRKKEIINKKLLRKITKLTAFIRLPLLIDNIMKTKTYSTILRNLKMKDIIIGKGTKIKVETYNWEETMKRYAKRLGLERSIVIENYIKNARKDFDTEKDRMDKISQIEVSEHAEMKIVEMIHDKIRTKNISHPISIFVSKLCCICCYSIILGLNKNKTLYKITGTHGKIYSGWKIPNIKDSIHHIRHTLDKIMEQQITHNSIGEIGSESGSEKGESPDENQEYMEYLRHRIDISEASMS